jgi:hypothetical protein
MGNKRRRRRPPQAPAVPTAEAATEGKPGRSRRFLTALWAVLLSTGLIAAVATALVRDSYPDVTDSIKEAVGGEALTLHTTAVDHLRPGPTRIWALPKAVDLDTEGDVQRLAAQLAEHDATPIRSTTYGVTVENQRSQTATVTYIRAKIGTRSEPLGGTVVDARTGGGPTDGPVTLWFDLDDLDLDARDAGGDRYLDANGLVVAPGEVLRFELLGTSNRSYVEWSVEFGVVVNDEPRTASTAIRGLFHTTAASRTYTRHYVWSSDGGLSATSADKLCAGDCRRLVR